MELSEQCVVEGLSGTIPPTEIFMDQDLDQQDKVRGPCGGGGHGALAARGHLFFSVSFLQGTTSYLMDSRVHRQFTEHLL